VSEFKVVGTEGMLLQTKVRFVENGSGGNTR
jgi:hypothetical protein